MFTKSPALKKRERWHNLLNKGHKFALIDDKTKVIDSAREKRALELTARFRPDLLMIDIADYLDKQS